MEPDAKSHQEIAHHDQFTQSAGRFGLSDSDRGFRAIYHLDS
jgi:hypothetical protein